MWRGLSHFMFRPDYGIESLAGCIRKSAEKFSTLSPAHAANMYGCPAERYGRSRMKLRRVQTSPLPWPLDSCVAMPQLFPQDRSRPLATSYLA